MEESIVIYTSKRSPVKFLAAFLALCFLNELIFPTVAFALTTGPAQQEYTSFEPVGTTDMVDLSSGDFTYNIPLLNIPGPNGGYPFNLAYHSGVGMEQEASWVGLGWTFNVGAINRQLRGIPDDFMGDEIVHEQHTKPSISVKLDIPENFSFKKLPGQAEQKEYFGFPVGPDATAITDRQSIAKQVYYNNFKGLGYRIIFSGQKQVKQTKFAAVSLGITADSQTGIGVSPGLAASHKGKEVEKTVGATAHYNSRAGLTDFSTSASIKVSQNLTGENSDSKEGKKTSSKESDEVKEVASKTFSSSLSFSTAQSIPSVSMSSYVTNIPFRVSIGNKMNQFGSFKAKFPGRWSGVVSTSMLTKNKGEAKRVTSPAFGYLHSEKRSNESQLMDFSRKKITYTKAIPNLPSLSYDYDIYSHTGQGSGGMFRPYRSDVTILKEREIISETDTRDNSLEFGVGEQASDPIFHIGAGYTRGSGINRSGTWKDGHSSLTQHAFPVSSNNVGNDPDYEPYYFKVHGEHTGELANDHHLIDWQGDIALRASIEKKGGFKDRYYGTPGSMNFTNSNIGANQGVTSKMKNKKNRPVRSKVFKSLTKSEADKYGMSKNLTYKSQNAQVSKFNNDHPEHHISEMEVLQPDGMRYIYGLPIYNTKHVETVMSITPPLGADFNTKRLALTQADAYKGTANEYYDKKELPPYVHSWLLTHIAGPDYIDRTGDGFTDDDMGYWVKFNYMESSKDFRWRVPYKEANFQEGHPSDPDDDVVNYTYGSREQFYLESVETRTHIAVFHKSDRLDALAAKEELAMVRGTERSKKLDKVELFTKKEHAKGVQLRTPIKTVHFKYDYSLCPETENNDHSNPMINCEGDDVTDPTEAINYKHGKLSLKKLYFTYGRNKKGKFSPYKFDYGDMNDKEINPPYEPHNMDRWGNFQNNRSVAGATGEYDNQVYPYVNFPYTRQKEGLTATAFEAGSDYVPTVGQWSLKKIDLPTGNEMKIEYEADDYAYVEDKKAMQMYDIIGFGNDVSDDREVIVFPNGEVPYRDQTSAITNHLKKHVSSSGDIIDGGNNFRVYFELEEPLPPGTSENERSKHIIERYVKGMNKLYFKSLIDLKGDEEHKDYVSGYADLVPVKDHDAAAKKDYYGAVKAIAGGDFTIGYITLEGMKINETNWTGIHAHPFQKNGLQHMRSNRSELIYDVVVDDGSAKSRIINLVGKTVKYAEELVQMGVSYNLFAYTKKWCEEAFLNGESIIRLYDANDRKIGGGVRVKKLSMTNNWAQDPIEYGQSYEYTIDEGGKTISSGVAYEPQVGGEESSLRQPLPYTQSNFLSSPQNLFMEKPLLDQFYPGASVTYRQVTVKSITPEVAAQDNKTINNSAAPITIYSFYTAKDFPIQIDQTDLTPESAINIPLGLPGVYTSFKRRLARSQGYSIVLNDMNGKPKKIQTRTRYFDNLFKKEDIVISSQEFVYQTKKPYSRQELNELDNNVLVLSDESTIEEAVIGESYDVFVNLHEESQSSKSKGVDGNLNVQILKVIPFVIPIPVPYPDVSDMETSVKTTVTTKVIHRSGILKEVITRTNESVLKQKNIAYDITTGEAILTETTNEFRDPIYNYQYPAHWYYEGLSGAYKNQGATFTNLSNAGNGWFYGFPSPINTANYFVPGAIFYVDDGAGTEQLAYLAEVGANSIQLIDEVGDPISYSTINAKLIRSGRTNQITTAAGSLVAADMGMGGANSTYPASYAPQNVIDASAVEFSDQWKTVCGGCGFDLEENTNPYRTGQKGIWRPFRTHVYQTDRINNHDIRKDGYYTTYTAFPWANPTSTGHNWRTANTITQYSPYGFELENMDPLGVYSSAQYGYDQALPTAVASNSKYAEVAFDGFEQYDCDDCLDDHFSFKHEKPKLTEEEAHSGRKSIRLAAGESVKMTRTLLNDCQ